MKHNKKLIEQIELLEQKAKNKLENNLIENNKILNNLPSQIDSLYTSNAQIEDAAKKHNIV